MSELISKKLSVLISVYKLEKPLHLRNALLSIKNQTIEAAEVVLVIDGEIGSNLHSVVNEFKGTLPLKVIQLEKNMGLANALNQGLLHCSYELIARMDSDDECYVNRLEAQFNFMESNPSIAVLSSWIDEYDSDMLCKIKTRRVPENHTQIFKFGKKRNPINHPATIFRKSAILDVGGYPNFSKAQDYALWSLLLIRGYKFSNLQFSTLKMRAGNNLLQRRGMHYLVNEYKVLSYQRKIGFLSTIEFIENLFIRTFFRLAPNKLKKYLYKIIG